MMWAWKVRRSTTAAARRGSVKVWPHSLKGWLLATATEVGLPWTMTYVGRSKESIPFRDELDRYGDRITVRTDHIAMQG